MNILLVTSGMSCTVTRKVGIKGENMKALIAVLTVFALTACGTVAGLGSDIQKSAEWTKEKMGGSK